MSGPEAGGPERPGPGWRALLSLLARLPQASLSRATGRFVDTPVPRPFRRLVLGSFARAVGIDASEAEHPLDAYPSVGAFFVRRLRAGARRWPGDSAVLASPVDGVVGQCGTVRGGQLLQAKGRSYSAAALLANDAEARRYEGGRFLTLYLSPRHYHRIHTPTRGAVVAARHVRGALLPVNRAAVSAVPDLFPRNERLMCFIDGPLGRVALVAIGAYNVGRISARFDPAWSGEAAPWITNRRRPPPPERHYDPPLALEEGEEVMAFHLGSTVVMLTEPGPLAFEGALEPGREVRVGEALARLRE